MQPTQRLNPFRFRSTFVHDLDAIRCHLKVSIPSDSGQRSYGRFVLFGTAWCLNPFRFRSTFVPLLDKLAIFFFRLNPFRFRSTFVPTSLQQPRSCLGLNPFRFRSTFVPFTGTDDALADVSQSLQIQVNVRTPNFKKRLMISIT